MPRTCCPYMLVPLPSDSSTYIEHIEHIVQGETPVCWDVCTCIWTFHSLRTERVALTPLSIHSLQFQRKNAYMLLTPMTCKDIIQKPHSRQVWQNKSTAKNTHHD
jgi:hypothetical protein